MATRYACLLVANVTPTPATQTTLLDLALQIAPRVADDGPGRVCLDLIGLDRLHPNESHFAEDLAAGAEAVGLTVSVAIASTRTTARIAAAVAPFTVVPPGREAVFLAPLPVSQSEPSLDLAAVLARWGVRTLGELAALPEAALIERLGDAGRAVQRRARGEDLDLFIPYHPPGVVEETVGLEWPIDTVDALAFVLGGLLDRLMMRLTSSGWALGAVDLSLGLADQSSTPYGLSLPSPLTDARAVLPLLLQNIRSSPPAGAVERVTARVRPAGVRLAQGGLFSATLVSPERLAATLTRLEGLVGRDAVGSPVLLDTHRPDAFAITAFPPASTARTPRRVEPASPILRRFRPPVPVEVVTNADGVPSRILEGPWKSIVQVAAGPWRSSGEWWTETRWSTEDWDVELSSGRVARLGYDRGRQTWTVTGVYD